MNELNITNEKIRKDLTFNYNGKEYEYSYGKDPQLNNNFTLLYQINKTKDEVLRIYDNNSTINEKYLDENVIDKNFFEVLKQNNLLDKTENYENFKSLNEKIDIYAKVGMSEINDFFDLKLNVDFGNYYKQISTNKESNEQLIDIDFYDKDLKSKNYIFHKTKILK